MAKTGRVSVRITADSSGVRKGTRDAEKDLGRLQSVSRRAGGGIGLAFKSAAGVIAAAGVADQIKETIQAAEREQVAQAKLATQLRATGISYKAHAKQIDEVINKTSALSGLEEHDLQDAFSNIVRSTGSVSKSLRLVGLAADIARTKNIDVAKAGQLVAKVAAGSTSALGRYGIVIKKGATATEALGILQQKFGGQAEAYGKTAAGAQDRFRVATEHLREKIGTALLPTITKLTDKASTFVQQMTDGTGAGGRFAHALGNIADKLAPIAKFFTEHPKIIAVAIGAWVAYRIAAAAAIAATRIKALGMFTGLAPRAAVGGAEAGGAFGASAATASRARLLKFGWVALGAGIGVLLGKAISDYLNKHFDFHVKIPGLTPLANSILGKLPPKGGPIVVGPTSPVPHGSSPTRTGRHPIGGSAPAAPKKRHTTTSVGQNAPGGVRARGASVGGAITAQVAGLTGRRLSGPQIAALWVGAGGNPASADTAVAVALAESGGYTGASNTNTDGSIDRGVWQINSVHGSLSTFDPAANARAAVQISGNGRNWTPWVTYNTGAYRRYLGQAGTGTGGAKASRGSLVAAITGGARPGRAIATLGKGVVAAVPAPGRLGVPKAKPIFKATPDPGAGGYGAASADELAAEGEFTGDPGTQQKARIVKLMQLYAKLRADDRVINAKHATRGAKAKALADKAQVLRDIKDVNDQGGVNFVPAPAPDASAADTGSPADATATDDTNTQLQAMNDKLQQLLDLEQQKAQDLQRALNTSQSQYGVFKQWLAGVVSGEIGGKIGLGFQTPSFAGRVASI